MCENVANWDAHLMSVDTKVYAKIDSPYYDTFPGRITGYDASNSEYIIEFDDLELGTRNVPESNVLSESEDKTDDEDDSYLNFFSDDDIFNVNQDEDRNNPELSFLYENNEISNSTSFSKEGTENSDANELKEDEKKSDDEMDSFDFSPLSDDEEKKPAPTKIKNKKKKKKKTKEGKKKSEKKHKKKNEKQSEKEAKQESSIDAQSEDDQQEQPNSTLRKANEKEYPQLNTPSKGEKEKPDENERKQQRTNSNMVNEDEDDENQDLKKLCDLEEKLSSNYDSKETAANNGDDDDDDDDADADADDEVYPANKCKKSFLKALARLEQFTRLKTTKIENLSKFNDTYENLDTSEEREKSQKRTVSILFAIHRLNSEIVEPLNIMHNFLKENDEKDKELEFYSEISLIVEKSICATELAYAHEMRKVRIESEFNKQFIKVFHTVLVLASHINPDNYKIIYSAIESMTADFSKQLTPKMAKQFKRIAYTYLHPMGTRSLYCEMMEPKKTINEKTQQRNESQQREEKAQSLTAVPLINEEDTTDTMNINENILFDLVPIDTREEVLFPMMTEDPNNIMYTSFPYNEQDEMMYPVISNEEVVVNVEPNTEENILYSSVPLVNEPTQEYSIFQNSMSENRFASIIETINLENAMGGGDNNDRILIPMFTEEEDEQQEMQYQDDESMEPMDDPDYLFQYRMPDIDPDDDSIEYTLQPHQY